MILLTILPHRWHTFFFLFEESSWNFQKFAHTKPSYRRAYKWTDPDAIAKIKLSQRGGGVKPHTPSLRFLWGTCPSSVYQTSLQQLLEKSVWTGIGHTSICSQRLGCIGLCIAQHQRLGQVLHLQNKAIDECTSSRLGGPTLGLQQSCTSPTVQDSAQDPSQVKPPYYCSQEHSPQTRRCSQCHGGLLRSESMRSGKG